MFFAFIHHNNAVANQWLGRSRVLSNETKLVLVTDEKGLLAIDNTPTKRVGGRLCCM